MSPPILTQATRTTSGLVELTLIFSTWIVSLPAKPEHRSQNAFSIQLLRTALYAISEPVYILLLLRTTLAPPILVIGTSCIYLGMATSFTSSMNVALAKSIHGASSSSMTVPETEKPQTTPQLREQPMDPELTSESRSEIDRLFPVFEYVFTQTSAASNASLLLLGQYLAVTNEEDSSTTMWLSIFALTFFLISRMVDYSIASLTQRPLFLGQRGLAADTWRQIQLLVVYFVVRTAVRLTLGMSSLGVFENAEVIEQLFKPGRDAWLQNFVLNLPAWLPSALSALSVGLTVLSHLYWSRLERQARETG